MPTLDKCLEMLANSKASARYEACEWLRVARESNQQVVEALEKALQDPDNEVAEAARKALDADVHLAMLAKLGRPKPKTDAEIRKEQEIQELASIIIVTTPSLENHLIKEYLGVVSAEVILGTGFKSELSAELADMFGARADKFQSKLKEAKAIALNELRMSAYELHANAILAIDLDYSIISNNMLMLVANGTAVIVEPR